MKIQAALTAPVDSVRKPLPNPSSIDVGNIKTPGQNPDDLDL
jgi:hypothetical protein